MKNVYQKFLPINILFLPSYALAIKCNPMIGTFNLYGKPYFRKDTHWEALRIVIMKKIIDNTYGWIVWRKIKIGAL